METHRTLATAGRDGILHLEVPVSMPGAEFEVVVVLQPSRQAESVPPHVHPDWPPHYFEKTFGSIDDPTFRRHDQGKFEERTSLE